MSQAAHLTQLFFQKSYTNLNIRIQMYLLILCLLRFYSFHNKGLQISKVVEKFINE